MAVAEARRAANRRNAQKSTGPRTEAGKERSKFNAVKHGMRAETLVIPGEDPRELESRRAAWYANLAPTDDVEASAVDDAVASTWMQDRARRAQAARIAIAANIANAGVEESKREADLVLRLGQKLFADNRGFLATYSHRDVQHENLNKRDPEHLVSYSDLADDPEDPPRIVLHLQSTLGGCQWMLERWGRGARKYNGFDDCAAVHTSNATNEANAVDISNATNEANAVDISTRRTKPTPSTSQTRRTKPTPSTSQTRRTKPTPSTSQRGERSQRDRRNRDERSHARGPQCVRNDRRVD